MVDKTYYTSHKSFKVFGIEIFKIDYCSTCYDGEGEFISESVPNKTYFEKEFRRDG